MEHEKKPGMADPEDVLRRLSFIDVTQRDFERQANLPQNFITQAKTRGKGRGPESQKWWDQALVTLEELEKTRAKLGGGNKASPSRPRDIPEDLELALKNLATEQDAIDLIKLIMQYAMRGVIPNQFMKTANEALSRFQQLSRQKRDVAEAAHAGDVVEVRVSYVNDWRQKGECPFCGGHGVIE